MILLRTGLAVASLCYCSGALLAQSTVPNASAIEAKGPEDLARKAPNIRPSGSDGSLVVKPYLQLGHTPAPRKIVLVWHAADVEAAWSVDFRPGSGRRWQAARAPSFRRVALNGVEPHRVYQAALTELEPGGTFTYRLMRGGKPVFESAGRAPKGPDQPYRFVAFGDCGANTPEQRQIAFHTFKLNPDLVAITGDIVYGRGLVLEYRKNFWPIYNADLASASSGAPLLRSILWTASPGNHDIASRDLDKTPDGLAYFYYWYQPLNGPTAQEGSPLVARVLGSERNKKPFTDAAADAFPRMANFSFDYANTHWTILDANATVDWTNRELQDWVARDLAAARGASWRFVNFHQPGFNSSKTHFDEQYMRILAPVFEKGKVDIVFNGHVHNYQRSYPLRFLPAAANGAAPILENGSRAKSRRVNGQYTLDKSYNGLSDTTPDGVIYVVTGAGGQHLYNPEQQDDPDSWQEFTYKHISRVYSLTMADVDGATLTVRQLTADGKEVDRFVITK